MKIVNNRFDFKTGKIVEELEDIKIKNFNDGEANSFYRQFLIDKGYKDNIGVLRTWNKSKPVQYLTLYGFPIKIRFVLWQAKKDTDTGKAVLWVGERNTVGFTQDQVMDAIVVGDRIIRTDVSYYGCIVTPRDFKVGMSLKSQPFVDFLLIPINAMIEIVKQTGKAYIDIRKEHREKYLFDNIIEQLKNSKIHEEIL
jgi:hypothetical protein